MAIYGVTRAPKVMSGLCVGDVRFVFGPPKSHAGATHKSGTSGAQIRHAILMPIGSILATFDWSDAQRFVNGPRLPSTGRKWRPIAVDGAKHETIHVRCRELIFLTISLIIRKTWNAVSVLLRCS